MDKKRDTNTKFYITILLGVIAFLNSELLTEEALANSDFELGFRFVNISLFLSAFLLLVSLNRFHLESTSKVKHKGFKPFFNGTLRWFRRIGIAIFLITYGVFLFFMF